MSKAGKLSPNSCAWRLVPALFAQSTESGQKLKDSKGRFSRNEKSTSYLDMMALILEARLDMITSNTEAR